MGRFHLNDLPKHKRIQMIAEFYDIIDSLKNRKEVRSFFKDLLTGDEIANFMRRIEVAVLLTAGFSYDQIVEILKVGKSKINNVQRVLIGEQKGEGYRLVIKRLLEDRKKRLKEQEKLEKESSSFDILKKKYPGHFLLFNLLDKISERLEDDSAIEKKALLYTPSLVLFKNKSHSSNKNKKGTSGNRKETFSNKKGTSGKKRRFSP